MRFNKFILSIIMSVLPVIVMAQQSGQDQIDMADVMRSNGKIYVVVAVMTIILTGLILYLISLDRKIFRLEKKLNSKKES